MCTVSEVKHKILLAFFTLSIIEKGYLKITGSRSSVAPIQLKH